MKRVLVNAENASRMFVAFVLTTDILAVTLAFVTAYIARSVIPWPAAAEGLPSFTVYLPMLAIHVASVILTFAIARLYSLPRASRMDEFYSIVAASSIGTLIGVALASLFLRGFVVGQDYSRVMIAYAWVLTMLLVLIGRLINGLLRRTLVRRGWGRRRLLLVGTGDVGRMIVQKLLWNPQLGYDLVGVVHMRPDAPVDILGVPVVGAVADLEHLIEQLVADEVIIALPEDIAHPDIMAIISQCERGRVTVRVYPDLFQIMAGAVSVIELGGIPILTVRDVAQTGWRSTAKRVMDIVGSITALILVSPLMMAVAIAIKLESPGPAFYVQERMGLDARPFPTIKFRSMRSDAERSGPGWTTAGDPRRTKVGAFLRKTNLDEFPQFINILLGDMSLVGPRPERPVYVEQFRRSIPRYMDRHREKAGLTGWAQVNGYRGDTSIAERTKYDLWYIENWSLWLDVKIIIRTVIQFFNSPNAY